MRSKAQRCDRCRHRRPRSLPYCHVCFEHACEHKLQWVSSAKPAVCPKCYQRAVQGEQFAELQAELWREHQARREPKNLSFAFTRPCVMEGIPGGAACGGAHHAISPHGHALCAVHLDQVEAGYPLDLGTGFEIRRAS